MKILFSNPCWWQNDPHHGLRAGIRAGSRWPFTMQAPCPPDEFRFGSYLPFPFFMGYAASYAQRAFPGAKVTLRDSIALRESYQGWQLFLRHTQPDWVIVESATPSWEHDKQCINLIHVTCPDAQIIVTGSIVSEHGKEAIGLPGVVAACKGEYEKSIVRVINGTRGVLEHDLLTKQEMNAAPFPMIAPETATHYWDACPVGQQAPQLQVWSSRGCPYKCVFCVWPATMTGNDPDGTNARSVRVYSPEYMKAFLVESIYRHGFKSVYFDDDTFNLVQKHTREMCEVMMMVQNTVAQEIPWSAMCRADTVDRATWQTMKDSGCFGVKLGFESGSQRVIDEIVNKRLDLKAAADTARFLRSIGMSVHGTFTIGLPGETPQEAQQTRDFILELYRTGAINSHQLSGTAEVEGTPLHTLRTAKHLDAYKGAVMDEHYRYNPDGQLKAEETLR